MVARNSANGLPEGWTVDCKVLNSGRKLKYYTDLKTGKKLYSRNEVYRYIKSNGGKTIKARTSSGKLSEESMKKNLQGIKRVNPHLKWLPKGWLIEVRQYEAGPTIGKRYKIYIDKSTGCKYYSKPQVLRYLMKQNDEGHMVREMNKATVTRSKSYKYENKSKTKMEKHLNNVKLDARPPNKKKLRTSRPARDAYRQSNRVVPHVEIIDDGIAKTSADKALMLSSKAIHPEKSADRGTYAVTSLFISDACVNAVQTRGSKRRQRLNLDNGCTSTSTAIMLKADIIPSGKLEMHCGSKTSKNRGSSTLPSRFSKRLAGIEPEVATSKKRSSSTLPSRFSKRLAGLEPEVVTNFSSRADAAKRSGRDQKNLALLKIENMNVRENAYESPPLTEVDSILKEEKRVRIRKKSNDSSCKTECVREGHLCRFSKRLAGLEPELGGAIPDLSEKPVRGVGKRSCTDEEALSISAPASTIVVHQGCHQQHSVNICRGLFDKSELEKGLEFHQSHSLGGNAGKVKSRRYSKRLAGDEPAIIWGGSRLPNTSQVIVPETLGGACNDEEQNPVWHSWSDPCLEFAFKTLTGEISIEDELQIESYFQQIKKPVQKDASVGSPDFSLTEKPFSRNPNSDSAVEYNGIIHQQANPDDTTREKTGTR